MAMAEPDLHRLRMMCAARARKSSRVFLGINERGGGLF